MMFSWFSVVELSGVSVVEALCVCAGSGCRS